MNKVLAVILPSEVSSDLGEPVIIGYTNYIIINTIKYFSLIACIVLFITIIFNKIKRRKIKKIIIIFFIISLIITFLAFGTDIYDELMRVILPYRYGV